MIISKNKKGSAIKAIVVCAIFTITLLGAIPAIAQQKTLEKQLERIRNLLYTL